MNKWLMKLMCASAVTVMCMGAMMPQITAFAERQYIVNGDFENDLNGWQATNRAESTVDLVDGSKGNTTKAVQLNTTKLGSCYIQQNVSGLREGDRLKLSFKMRFAEALQDNMDEKGVDDSGLAFVTIGYYDTSNGPGECIGEFSQRYYDVSGDEWVNREIDILMPVGADKLNILFRQAHGGTVLYDDISLTDSENETHLTITNEDFELSSVPEGVESMIAKLHYVPEEKKDNVNLILALYENAEDGTRKLIDLKIQPFAATAATYKELSMDVPQTEGELSAAAYVWRRGETLDAVAESCILPKNGTRLLYDRYAVDRMRGICGPLTIFYDEESMDKLLDTGLNTFIINLLGTYYGGEINADMDALDKVCADIDAFIDKSGADVFMKASYGANCFYKNTEFGAYHPGVNHSLNLPCPLSEEYWENEMLKRASVVASHPKIKGIVFDMEMYSGGSTRFPNACFCDSCVESFETETGEEGLVTQKITARRAYVRNNELYDIYAKWFEKKVTEISSKIRLKLHEINPNLILGYMPEYEWLPGITQGLGTKEMPVIVFNENEYQGEILKSQMHIAHIKRDNMPAVYAIGLWADEQQAIKKQDFAAKMIKAEPINVGYWIYSMGELNNDTEYYDVIKKGNEMLDKK